MKIEIKHVNGHYELYINDTFRGSFDTASEAAKEIETIKE